MTSTCGWLRRATLALLVVLAASQAVQAADEEEIRRAEADWVRALVAGDMAALEALYSDDLRYVHSSGGIDTKRQFLDSIRSGALRFKSMTAGDSRVRTYGDTGVVNARYDLVLELGRKDVVPMTIQYLTVYVKSGSRWQIVTQQTTRVPDRRAAR